MDFQESPEQSALREAVAGIATRYGHDYYRAQSAQHAGLTEIWQELGSAGFLGVMIAEEYGGGGAGLTELATVSEELAAHGCPVLMIVVSPAICGLLIERFGSTEQRERYLPGLATGATMMAFAITEPDAGSNAHAIATRARRVEDGWSLRGAKHFISGVDQADFVVVVASTGDTSSALSIFVVPTDSPGLRLEPIDVEITSPDKQFILSFDDVELPGQALLGDEGQAMRQMFHGLNAERVLSATIANGVGRYALRKASEYALSRSVFGTTSIGAYQAIAHPLARAATALEQSRLLTSKASWLNDRGADPRATGEVANMAKLASSQAGMAALDAAIQTHGGNGMASEYGLATLWGSTRLIQIAPISNEMVLNGIAQFTLGLPKSY